MDKLIRILIPHGKLMFLVGLSKRTGQPVGKLINRAIDDFIRKHTPVYSPPKPTNKG